MATSLNRTYEVTLPTTFKKWSAFLDFTSDLDWWAAFDLNPRCVFGGYANELLAKAFAPIALVAAVLLLSTGAHCAARSRHVVWWSHLDCVGGAAAGSRDG